MGQSTTYRLSGCSSSSSPRATSLGLTVRTIVSNDVAGVYNVTDAAGAVVGRRYVGEPRFVELGLGDDEVAVKGTSPSGRTRTSTAPRTAWTSSPSATPSSSSAWSQSSSGARTTTNRVSARTPSPPPLWHVDRPCKGMYRTGYPFCCRTRYYPETWYENETIYNPETFRST